jgi:acyl carrier protein
MDKAEILNRVTNVFRDVLDIDDLVLDYNTTANDVEEWDSLNHIQLVVGVEREFKIRFPSQEIQSWGTVGDMVNSVYAKVS